MFTPASLILALLVLVAPSSQAGGDWTGKAIFTKKAGVKLAPTDASDKKTVPVELTYAAYDVIQEKDGKLKIRHNAVEGWLDKADAVVAEDGVEFFTAQIKTNPKDSVAHAKRAWARTIRGELDGALQDAEQAIRLDPQLAAGWECRGSISYHKKDFDQAIKDFGQAIKLDSNHLHAYLLRGFALGMNKQTDAAIKDLDQVIRIDSQKPEWWVIRGMAHAENKALAQARKDLDTALKLNPQMAGAYFSRGQVVLELKDPDAALKDFDQALKLNFNAPELYAFRARAWSDKKDFPKAVKEWEEAIRVDPRNPGSYNSLAWLLATCPDAKVRDGKRAIEVGTKACELSNWKSSGDIDTLAAAYAEAGRFDEAVRFQMQALQDPELAGPAGDEFRARLELYKNKMPYREK